MSNHNHNGYNFCFQEQKGTIKIYYCEHKNTKKCSSYLRLDSENNESISSPHVSSCKLHKKRSEKSKKSAIQDSTILDINGNTISSIIGEEFQLEPLLNQKNRVTMNNGSFFSEGISSNNQKETDCDSSASKIMNSFFEKSIEEEINSISTNKVNGISSINSDVGNNIDSESGSFFPSKVTELVIQNERESYIKLVEKADPSLESQRKANVKIKIMRMKKPKRPIVVQIYKQCFVMFGPVMRNWINVHRTYYLSEDKKITGCYTYRNCYFQSVNYINLLLLAVKQGNQLKGKGKIMIDYLTKSCKIIILWADNGVTGFYERLGFDYVTGEKNHLEKLIIFETDSKLMMCGFSDSIGEKLKLRLDENIEE